MYINNTLGLEIQILNMAGALNRIDSLKYMSDYENRLRRFKSNLQHIFDKVSTLWSEMFLWIGGKILMFYRFRKTSTISINFFIKIYVHDHHKLILDVC